MAGCKCHLRLQIFAVTHELLLTTCQSLRGSMQSVETHIKLLYYELGPSHLFELNRFTCTSDSIDSRNFHGIDFHAHIF